MEAMTDTVVSVQLNMNEREARWLMAIMQNPMLAPGEYEGDECRTMRENFFLTLRDELEE